MTISRTTRPLALLGLLVLGCQPAVIADWATFPRAAALGDTVGLLVTHSSRVGIDGISNRADLTRESVRLRIADESGTGYVEIAPRGVFEVNLSRARSNSLLLSAGTWATVAVFDVPESLQFASYPATTSINVRVHELPLAYQAVLKVTGPGGVPTESIPDPAQLEHPPLLRLRARVGPGAFDPDWRIGVLEFELHHPDAVSDPVAAANSEAIRAGAHAGPGPVPNSIRIVIVDPEGFTLSDQADIFSSTNGLGGMGPFLDIGFDKAAPFSVDDFEIRQLMVGDVDGNVLLDRGSQDSSELFELLVLNNQ